jgi:hypothetical protein
MQAQAHALVQFLRRRDGVGDREYLRHRRRCAITARANRPASA